MIVEDDFRGQTPDAHGPAHAGVHHALTGVLELTDVAWPASLPTWLITGITRSSMPASISSRFLVSSRVASSCARRRAISFSSYCLERSASLSWASERRPSLILACRSLISWAGRRAPSPAAPGAS